MTAGYDFLGHFDVMEQCYSRTPSTYSSTWLEASNLGKFQKQNSGKEMKKPKQR